MAALAKQNKPFRYASFKSLNKKQFPLKNLHEPSPTAPSIAVSGKFIAAGFGSKGIITERPTHNIRIMTGMLICIIRMHASI
jgi:hypothetical protein